MKLIGNLRVKDSNVYDAQTLELDNNTPLNIRLKTHVRLVNTQAEGNPVVITLPPGTAPILTNQFAVLTNGSDSDSKSIIISTTNTGLQAPLQLQRGESTVIIRSGTVWMLSTKSQTPLSAGLVEPSTFTKLYPAKIRVTETRVHLYDNATFLGNPQLFVIPQTDLTLTDMSTNYVVAERTANSAQLRVTLDVNEINEANIVPVFTIYRTGDFLHTIDWNSLGTGLANRIHTSLVKTQRYRREFGLQLSEFGTRNLSCTAGRVFIGANPVNILETTSDVDAMFFSYKVAGAWTYSLVNQYNNSQYQGVSDLEALLPNRYAVNFVFRGVEQEKHLYIVLGTQNATLAQAQQQSVPEVPDLISSHAILVGKIIVQSGDNTAESIQSAFDNVFTYAGITSHNNLTERDIAGNHTRLIPLTDSETAIAITKADGTTRILTIDTLNEKIVAKADYVPQEAKDLTPKDYVDGEVATKQDALVSGTSIKTINGETVLGSGNLVVEGTPPANVVTTDTNQTITGTKTFSQTTFSHTIFANGGINLAGLPGGVQDGLIWYI